MPTNEGEELLADFEAGQVDPGNFPHRAHVQVSYELLERHPFPEALLHLARGLRGFPFSDRGAPVQRALCELGRFRRAQSGSFPERITRRLLPA